jgi:hypothetical protein
MQFISRRPHILALASVKPVKQIWYSFFFAGKQIWYSVCTFSCSCVDILGQRLIFSTVVHIRRTTGIQISKSRQSHHKLISLGIQVLYYWLYIEVRFTIFFEDFFVSFSIRILRVNYLLQTSIRIMILADASWYYVMTRELRNFLLPNKKKCIKYLFLP